MDNFEFCSKTRVVFGKGQLNRLGALLQESKASKVLIHYGGNSARKNGILDSIYKILNASNIKYVELGGVVPNPRLKLALEGIEIVKKENVDFILSVGGGSVIDSAKCIAARCLL